MKLAIFIIATLVAVGCLFKMLFEIAPSPAKTQSNKRKNVNVLVESVTRFTVGAQTVRVWREELNNPPYNADLEARAVELDGMGVGGRVLGLNLLRLDRVNAVEVVDENNIGFVVYRLEDDGSF